MNEPSLIICPVCGYQNDTQNNYCIRCNSLLRPETNKLEQAEEFDIEPKWGSKDTGKRLYLHVHGHSESIEIALSEGMALVIGRRDPSTNHLPGIDLANYDAGNLGVSRKHAILTYEGTSLKVADMNSANFTYLNGQKLVPNHARLVRDGDDLRLGRLRVTVQFG
ncbi:MAG: FHA domain-containing protein [Anaerolineales bacterium]